jgi:hypothetical protein
VGTERGGLRQGLRDNVGNRLTPNYLKASLNHFLKVGWNYYLPDSAARVYANLVGAALKAGIPVSYNDNPLLSASLPTDLKVNLKVTIPRRMPCAPCFGMRIKPNP